MRIADRAGSGADAPPRWLRVPRARTLAVALVLPLLLTACGGADDKGSSIEPSDGMVSMPAPMPGFEGGGDVAMLDRSPGAVTSSGGSADPTAITTDGRAVVRNAYLDLIVDDGARAVAAITAQASAVGGYVSSTNLSRAEDGTVSGMLTLRVPAERLDETVEALDALARAVPTRNVDEYDVTLQLSDLDARLLNLRAYETELRALLAEVREQGGGAEDLLAVSDRLRDVRTEIDMTEAWRTQIATDVALSTVTVWVQQARSTTPVVGTWDLPGVVRDALATALALGRRAVEGIVYAVITGVPVLVVLLVVWRLVRLVRRRRSERYRRTHAEAQTDG
jgi:hypothetical protein